MLNSSDWFFQFELFFASDFWYYVFMRKNDKKVVDCKKIEKRIPLYLSDKLSVYETLAFLNHIKECPSCKEELTIQYMVSEGLNKAEEENNYDLYKGLDLKINESYKKIKNHDLTYLLVSFLTCMAVCLFVAAILLIVL